MLMLTLSLAAPLLERSELFAETVFESQHDPATCPTAHDHRICAQVGANLAAPSRAQEHQLTDAIVSAAAPAVTGIVLLAAYSEGHRSRAPPLA